MLDGRYVADHLDDVRAGLARRSPETAALLDDASAAFARRRELIGKTEALQAKRNSESQAMGQLAKSGDKAAFEARRAELKQLSDQIKELEAELAEAERAVEDKLLGIPNLPHATAPDGKGEEDNPTRRTWGTAPSFDFDPKAHWDLGPELGILDFDRAAKLSGARFVVLRGLGARLERALIQLMLDLHVDEHGYTEMWVPTLVKDTALHGTGQLPKFAADLFRIAKDAQWEREAEAGGHELFLIPTAEVPLTNLHAGEILDAGDLPVAYTAYTACFRSEAGSYGKDTRGMIRQHQFDKVELVRFVRPDDALAELERLTGHAEAVLQRLGLCYRVVELCAGDLGFSSKKTYDLEVWLPGQNAYREISSCSWFGDFQARRLKARFRPAPDDKPQLVHTLNGSGLAVGRTLVAILEQYQLPDGSVRVPPALRPYLGGLDTLRPPG